MIIWSAPLWLLGLALVPLIWQLHRLRRSGPVFLVSSLLLWRSRTEPEEAGRHTARADRIWWLRALVVAVLSLALAGPGWLTNARTAVHVWVDDSLSMASVESPDSASRLTPSAGEAQRSNAVPPEEQKTWAATLKSTRMVLAQQKLLAALNERGASRVEIHSLTDPARPVLELSNSPRSEWESLLAGWTKIGVRTLQPPLPVQMPVGAEHWVLTDGADDQLNEWTATAPVSRVVQSGQETENSAIERIALKRSERRADVWLGLIQVANLGLKPARRKLSLSIDGREQQAWDMETLPGTSRQIEFELPASSSGEIAATLQPGDALNLDDRLALTLPQPVAARILGNCAQPIMAALRTHPGITLDGEPQLTVVCGESAPPGPGATLRLHGGERPRSLKSPAVWLDRADKLGRLPLSGEWLEAFEPAPTQATPLLVAGPTPLVTLAESPFRQVDSYLDLAQSKFVRQPEFPALIAGLIDMALAADLLDGARSEWRPSAQSLVAPKVLPEPPLSGRSRAFETATVDPVPALVLALMMALLADEWLSGSRRHRPMRG